MSVTVAVLALQGAFAKHAQMIESLGAKALLAKKPNDLLEADGLIIPGGESTTIFKQIDFIQLMPALQEFVKTKPLFGTCAGLILMSREVIGFPNMQPLKLLDIAVERNAFGRQTESFNTDLEIHLPSSKEFIAPAIFIRAPRIRQTGPDVKILASYEGEPVLVQQGSNLGSSFHPELTNDTRVHQHFLSLVKKNSGK